MGFDSLARRGCHDESMWPSIALALAIVATLIAGCEKNEPAGDPAAEIRRAARATLAQPWQAMDVRVTSRRTAYSVRGLIEPAAERYAGRASFTRGAEAVAPDPPFNIVGTGSEAYIGGANLISTFEDRRCWFDPHLPIGSAARTASVQESLALVGIVIRLLARATERAEVAHSEEAAASYRAWVDPEQAEALYSSGDELSEARPRELAGAIELPLGIETRANRLSRISLKLPRFEPAAFLRRYGGVATVSIEVSLRPTDKRPGLRTPNCIAME